MVNKFYKFCGYIVYACVGFIVIVKIMNSILEKEYLENTAYIFWLEAIAVWAFGSAWLIKGKIDRSVKNLYYKIKNKI